jgi:thiol-disulfide isomerase/thioredoxin
MKKNKTTWIIIGLLVIIALAVGYVLANQNRPTNELTPDPNNNGSNTEEPVAAPDFSLIDLEGQSVRLSDFKGKYVFLNFWASWCGPCKDEMPDMERIHQKYGDDIVILAVNLGDSKTIVEEFSQEYGLTFQILLDEKSEVGSMYQVSGIPTSYFIDKEGHFASGFMGALTYDQMVEAIDQLMN